jgi:hypothetical protein
VTRSGRTNRSGTITLTAEPFNLTKKNTFKDSGLANSSAMGVELKEVEDPKDKYGPKLVLTTKVRWDPLHAGGSGDSRQEGWGSLT